MNECFICGDDNEKVLQEHHIVPKRYDGSDRDENLVWLCASCHQAIEKLYDDSFYERLGVEKGWRQIEFTKVTTINDFVVNGLYFVRDENEVYRYKGSDDLEALGTDYEFRKLEPKRRPEKVSTDKEGLESFLESNDVVHVESDLSYDTIIERLHE